MKYSARLLETAPGAERGRALHRMIEREMGVAGMFPTSCSKGCSGCCHYEVEVTEDEAAVLKERVAAGFAIDRSRLAVQAARERRSAEWRKFCAARTTAAFSSARTARAASTRTGLRSAASTWSRLPRRRAQPTEPRWRRCRRRWQQIALSAGLSSDGVEFGSLAKMLSRELAA